MAFPVIAATAASATAADATSHVCSLPSGIASGHLLLAVVVCDGDGAMTWPAGWTALTNGAGASGTAVRSEARYRVATGSEGSSITIDGSNEAWVSRVWRITGFSGTPTCAAATGTSADARPPYLGDPAYARNSLWLVHVAWDGRPGFTFWPEPYGLNARLAEHISESGAGSGEVKQASVGLHTVGRGLTPGPCTSASAAWRALTINVLPTTTDEADAAALVAAQRLAEYGV